MVDINLIGDDKDQQDNNFNNDDYSNRFDADSREYSSTESDFPDHDLDHSIYDRSYAKGGSRKAAFIIGGVIIAVSILLVAYFVVYKSKNKPVVTNTKPIIETPSIPPDTLVNIPKPPAIEIPGYIKDMMTSTQHGVRTVENILATIPQDINFTMIQYRDGNFLAELLGKSPASITNLNDQLQQKTISGNVKILSKDKKNISGFTYQQALINGSLASSVTEILALPNYLDPQSIKNEFAGFCQQYGLSLKQFDVKNEMASQNYKKIPVIFRAVGTRDSALNFLNKIIERNINVNFSKITLVAPESNLNSGKIALILNLEIYNQI